VENVKVPNSKTQKTNKYQIPIPKEQDVLIEIFELGSLGMICFLVLGIWQFSFFALFPLRLATLH
jgi:hypothetical protein